MILHFILTFKSLGSVSSKMQYFYSARIH